MTRFQEPVQSKPQLVPLPALREFTVTRWDAVQGTVESVRVLAHSVTFAEGALSFYEVVYDENNELGTRMRHAFKEWLDVKEVNIVVKRSESVLVH